ncbi:hypothetical protein V8C86DRAFT_2571270 [Haematococcus lacustris]
MACMQPASYSAACQHAGLVAIHHFFHKITARCSRCLPLPSQQLTYHWTASQGSPCRSGTSRHSFVAGSSWLWQMSTTQLFALHQPRGVSGAVRPQPACIPTHPSRRRPGIRSAWPGLGTGLSVVGLDLAGWHNKAVDVSMLLLAHHLPAPPTQAASGPPLGVVFCLYGANLLRWQLACRMAELPARAVAPPPPSPLPSASTSLAWTPSYFPDPDTS